MRRWFTELKVVHKLLLMGLFFLLPDSAMLCMLISDANENIGFAQQEVRGNAYLRPLVHLLYLLPRYQQGLLTPVSTEGDRAAAIGGITAQIDSALRSLQQVDQATGQQLKFTDVELGLRGRSDAKLSYLQEDWETIQKSPAGVDIQAVVNRMLSRVRVMMTHAGDMSNLILDPDLDSYYLMDATLLSLPAVEDQLNRASEDGLKFFDSNQAGSDKLSEMHSAILHQSLDHITNSVQTSLREESGSASAKVAMRQSLSPKLDDFRTALQAFIDATDGLGNGLTSALAYATASDRARDAGMQLWDSSSVELDKLLLTRVSLYRHRERTAVSITAAAILAASLLVGFINRSINRPLQKQAESLRQLNEALTREGKLLIEAQEALVDASRRAGMAEIASGVLHNVGNVLNSVNTSATVIRERIEQSKVPTLSKAAAMMREHREDAGAFFSSDPRGQMFPDLLTRLADLMESERGLIGEEVAQLVKNVDHIKGIVHAQQSFSKAGEQKEETNLAELIEDALRISGLNRGQSGIEIVRDFEPCDAAMLDKHRVLQMLVNVISNAKKAVYDSEMKPRRITISLSTSGEASDARARIQITDTGVGIAPEHLRKIFQHGFTTRKDGHGFGLHTAANDANAMGGSISVASPGVGQGATFTLEIPLAQAKVVQL